MTKTIGEQAHWLATFEQHRQNGIFVECQVAMIPDINKQILASARTGKFHISISVTGMLHKALQRYPDVHYSTDRAEEVRTRLKYHYDADPALSVHYEEEISSDGRHPMMMYFSWVNK